MRPVVLGKRNHGRLKEPRPAYSQVQLSDRENFEQRSGLMRLLLLLQLLLSAILLKCLLVTSVGALNVSFRILIKPYKILLLLKIKVVFCRGFLVMQVPLAIC